MFCDAPPHPDPVYELALVKESYYKYSIWGDFRVPLNALVHFKCIADAKLENNSSLTSFYIECTDITTGAYNDFTWPQCGRS